MAEITGKSNLDVGRSVRSLLVPGVSPSLCGRVDWRWIDADDDETAREEVEDAPEDERDERAAHDDHVVRHAEVRRGQIDEQHGRVHPSWPQHKTALLCAARRAVSVVLAVRRRREWNENGRGQVPAALRVGLVLRVA